MDISNHFSARIPTIAPRNPAAGQTDTSVPEVSNLSGSAYKRLLDELTSREHSIDPSAKLYNGSATRAQLSDTEIAVLANKYDVHKMDDEDFDSFLDELEGMGAISNLEKQQLGYKGMMYVDIPQGGDLMMSAAWAVPCAAGEDAPIFNREEADGDVFRWINDRIQWQRSYSRDPAQRKIQEDDENLNQLLAGIINRMDGCRGEDAEKADLLRQLADADSDFYSAMRLKLRQSMEEREEQEREQAVIDALGMILDAMSGVKDAKRSDVPQSAAEIARRIGEYDPDDPERVRLAQLLRRMSELGLYVDLAGLDGTADRESTFETLTRLLMKKEAQAAQNSASQ